MKKEVITMNNYLILLLICIYNSILIYGKSLGINVILFIIPLLIFIICIYKEKKLIKNKYGLLFSIPITLLSLTYLIYDNIFFKLTNVPVIIVLFLLMHIFTIKPEYNLMNLLNNAIVLIIQPLTFIGDSFKEIKNGILPKEKGQKKSKINIKPFLIIIPVVLIVLYLLSSADSIFGSVFTNIFKVLGRIKISDAIVEIIGRIILIILLFSYIAGTLYYLTKKYSKEDNTVLDNKIKIEDKTIKTLLTILNVIYIIFDIIQITALIFKKIPANMTYANYARQGFFQLMLVSIINLSIILIAKNSDKKSSRKYINIMSYLMILLTLIIIISSYLRMNLYSTAYGYTLLRLLVYFTLITEVILLIPTIAYINNPNIKIIKYYMIIIVTIYTLINFTNMDVLIAKKNIELYKENDRIDIDYLMNYSTDNIEELINLYPKVKKEPDRLALRNYLIDMYKNEKIPFQEYNISRNKANNLLRNYVNEQYYK